MYRACEAVEHINMSNETAVIAPLWGENTHSRKSPTSCLQPPNSVPVVIVPDRLASYHVYTAKGFTVRFETAVLHQRH